MEDDLEQWEDLGRYGAQDAFMKGWLLQFWRALQMRE
jgi:hypothetical protein